MPTELVQSALDVLGFGVGQRIGDFVIAGSSSSGGMGRVFPAVHVSSGRRVALKTVTTTDDASLAYFEHEISALASLNHPAVVPIRAHGVLHGRPWYAMDWLDGPTLRSLLQQSSGGALGPAHATLRADQPAQPEQRNSDSGSPEAHFDRETLLGLCIQILHALDYVHSKGIIHGDLKPENVFVLPGPRPVLVDFGIAHWFAVSRESLQLVPRAIGSAAYMAPEQIRGAIADTRADLYAMGCLFYESLTGVNPFQRSTAEATMLAQLNGKVEPLSTRAASIPSALDSIVQRLLSKSAADRPRYAREVLASLASQRTGAGAKPEVQSVPGPLYRSALLGRESALLRVRDSIALACGGQSTKLLVQGEAGIGKTRLMLEALNLGSRGQLRVFCVRCDDGEARAGHDLLAPLRPFIAALGDAGVALTEPPNDGAEREAWVERAAASLLAACRKRPFLLAVDDVDRADELTKSVLQRVALAATAEDRLVLLCTESLGRATNFRGFQSIVLEPLSREQVELAVCSILATEYASPNLVDVVHERSQGNPLMLGQFLHALLGEGLLVHSRHSGWHLSSAFRSEASPASPSAEGEFWRSRLRALSARELQLARTAAVLGRTFAVSLLSAVAEQDEAEVRAVLARLVSLDIVQASSMEWYRFAHAQLVESLYEQVPAAEVPACHARTAQVMARLAQEDSAAFMMGLAWHLRQSGQHEEAARSYQTAGDLYARTLCFQQAYDALVLAKRELDLCPQRSAQAVTLCVAEALGDAALLLRRLDAAESAYSEALALARNETAVAARLHRKLAGASQRDHDQAARLLSTAISLLGQPSTEDETLLFEWLQSHLDLMFVYYWKRDPARVLEIGRAIKARLDTHGSAEQQASYSFNVAAGLMALHRYVTGPTELELIEQALSFYAAKNDRLKAGMASFLRAMILLFGNELERASAGFESILAIGKKTASFTIQVRALAYLCLVHRRRRDEEKLRRVASATLGLAKEHDMPEYQGLALGNLAWLAYQGADLAECEQLARQAIACWSVAGTKTAFCWTAMLPLAAALARSSGEASAVEVRAIASALLEESQQALRLPLAKALLEVASDDSLRLVLAMQRTVEAAVAEGFM